MVLVQELEGAGQAFELVRDLRRQRRSDHREIFHLGGLSSERFSSPVTKNCRGELLGSGYRVPLFLSRLMLCIALG
jgi:hypothetical protein